MSYHQPNEVELGAPGVAKVFWLYSKGRKIFSIMVNELLLQLESSVPLAMGHLRSAERRSLFTVSLIPI